MSTLAARLRGGGVGENGSDSAWESHRTAAHFLGLGGSRWSEGVRPPSFSLGSSSPRKASFGCGLGAVPVVSGCAVGGVSAWPFMSAGLGLRVELSGVLAAYTNG
jgi:hypothetical protein